MNIGLWVLISWLHYLCCSCSPLGGCFGCLPGEVTYHLTTSANGDQNHVSGSDKFWSLDSFTGIARFHLSPDRGTFAQLLFAYGDSEGCCCCCCGPACSCCSNIKHALTHGCFCLGVWFKEKVCPPLPWLSPNYVTALRTWLLICCLVYVIPLICSHISADSGYVSADILCMLCWCCVECTVGRGVRQDCSSGVDEIQPVERRWTASLLGRHCASFQEKIERRVGFGSLWRHGPFEMSSFHWHSSNPIHKDLHTNFWQFRYFTSILLLESIYWILLLFNFVLWLCRTWH